MESPARTTVLVVDDERALVRLVRSYLERERFRVIEAFDGRHALDAARAEGPDVIVLDLMLPGIDGLEVAREIRTFSDAYIIMLAARAEEVDRVVGLSVGEPVGGVELLGKRDATVKSHPAHDLGVQVVARRAAELPDALTASKVGRGTVVRS